MTEVQVTVSVLDGVYIYNAEREQVLFFASARDAVGHASESLRLPAQSSIATVRQNLELKNREIRDVLAKSRLSHNEELVSDEAQALLQPGDIVAVIPPVSGG